MSCPCGAFGPVCILRNAVVPRAEAERTITAAAVDRLRRMGWRPVLLDGIRVRWLGVVWRGVPEPLRWALECRTMLPRELPGCGCVDTLKRLVEYARSIARDKRGAT